MFISLHFTTKHTHMKTYYHIIEDANNGNIATHGYKTTEAEAQREADRLKSFFPKLTFYVHPSPSKREPEFITL